MSTDIDLSRDSSETTITPTTTHVLVIDDDQEICDLITRILSRRGYVPESASNTNRAHQILGRGEIDLVLCDVMMPGQSGIDLLTRLRKEEPDVPVVMISGVTDPDLADVALKLGAYGYVTKPFDANQVLIAVANALHRDRLEQQNREYRERLEWMVTERTVELADALHELESVNGAIRNSSELTIQALAQAIEGRDVETGAHVVRMSRYTRLLANAIDLDDEHCEQIGVAAAMHDVGKVGVPDGILFKPGKFSAAEYEVIKQHAELGYHILSKSDEPLLTMAATVAYTHHEKWDGSGYPRGLAGEVIPIEGRIAAVADVFDALVSRRVYKPPYSLDRSLQILRDGRGSHFDPLVLDAFLDHLDDVVAIQSQYHDD